MTKNSDTASQPQEGRLPDFLIIGAAKSGTTTLHSYLERHSMVCMSTPKEPEYFSRQEIYEKGEAWYRGLFSEARADQLCGEASTTYTRWPHTQDAAGRIGKLLPNAKLIYIMRNPVDRTYSHFVHHTRYAINKTFEQALADDDIYVDCSRYLFQIKRYLEFYPRESFLFLFFDDLKENPGALLQRIQAFLGLPEEDLCSEGLVYANVAGVDHYIRHWTTDWIRELPGMRQLRKMLSTETKQHMYNFLKSSFIGKKMARDYNPPEMQPGTRERLIELFRPENEALAEFLGCDLSDWNR
ncbi:MAG: sulfotransferase domain-containing protein [Planctomycetes bacterium]|nr:sulfotransferase domain-containing protein [Planctomycetota bacterium]